MAIPFNIPTDEETAAHYRRMDQLLKDIYDIVLQIVLLRRLPVDLPQTPETQHARSHRRHRHGLPDVVRNQVHRRRRSMKSQQQQRQLQARQQRPRQILNDEFINTQQQNDYHPHIQELNNNLSQPISGSSWLNVGIQLRGIAAEIRSTQTGKEDPKNEFKASNLFSLLIPAPLNAPIWTTVILIVGWRLLCRSR